MGNKLLLNCIIFGVIVLFIGVNFSQSAVPKIVVDEIRISAINGFLEEQTIQDERGDVLAMDLTSDECNYTNEKPNVDIKQLTYSKPDGSTEATLILEVYGTIEDRGSLDEDSIESLNSVIYSITLETSKEIYSITYVNQSCQLTSGGSLDIVNITDYTKSGGVLTIHFDLTTNDETYVDFSAETLDFKFDLTGESGGMYADMAPNEENLIVEIYGPTAGYIGEELQFEGEASDYYGIPGTYSYHWDFDDGSTSTMQNPTHSYTAEGKHEITLRVTDEKTNHSVEAGHVVTIFSTGTYVVFVDDDNTKGPWNGTLEHPYQFIQDGIDEADDGETVYVFRGTYHENIELDKRLSLIGEDKKTTIIDGKQEGCTINLSSENTSIENFTILGGGFDTDEFIHFFRAGIRVTGSNNSICHNIFRKNCLGISAVRVTNLTIKDNIFMEDGIGFTSYENDGRPILKMKYFVHNIENNSVNGKPLYYFLNEKDKIIDNWEVGQLILVNCTNFIIKNVSISNTDWGLVFAFCNKCSTEKCHFFNNGLAIWTLKSDNNLFQFNNISHNYHRGVVIDYNSNRNIIKYNKISNTFCGVEIEWWSNANVITKNNFLNNNVSGYEHQSLLSTWYKNYYDNWIGLKKPLLFFLPKLIYGMPIERIPRLVMPVSIDFFPAKEPYDISVCS